MTTEPESESKIQRHFVELATRTLEAQPELRDEARGELMGRLAHSGAKEEEVENALCQLAKIVPQRWSRKGMLTGSVMLLMLGSLVFLQIRATRPEREVLRIALGERYAAHEWFVQLSESDRRFFAMDIGKKPFTSPGQSRDEVLNELEDLGKMHPVDAGIHELHAINFITSFSDVPPGYREMWQRIDPDNGIWATWEAAALTLADGGKPRRSIEETERDTTEAMRLLEQALAEKTLCSNVSDLRARQFALLPELPTTVVGNAALHRLSDPLRRFHPANSLEASGLPALFYLKGEEMVRKQDREGLQKLLHFWKIFCSRWLQGVKTWNELDSKLFLISIGENLALHAGALGLTAEQTRLTVLLDRVEEFVPSGSANGNFGAGTTPDLRPMSTLAAHRARSTQYRHKAEALRPGRMSEYLAAERYFALGASILLLIPLAAVWLESCRRGKRVNGLADGLAPVFTAGDAGWLLGLGCGLPLLWYFGITRLTQLGCRDIGVSYFARPIPPAAIQLTATLLLSGVLMFQTGTMLLRKRLGFLGLGGRFPAAGWAVAAVTALLVPLAGAVRWLNRDEQEFLQGVAAACGIPLLWLMWQAGMIVFSPSSGALRGVLLSRRLISPLAVACLALLALQPLLLSNERQWLAKDTVSRSDPAHGGIPIGEAMAVERISKALSDLLAEPE